MSISAAATIDAAAAGKGRMRAAIVVDLAVGLVIIPALTFCLAQAQAFITAISPDVARRGPTWWDVLLMSALAFALGGAVVALLARLATRGQTPGLAVVRLCWGDAAGRAARRRLLGEPQFWCAALPAVYLLLVCLVGTPQYFLVFTPLFGVLSTIGALIGPVLVLGALACMVVSRRYPGRLVPRG